MHDAPPTASSSASSDDDGGGGGGGPSEWAVPLLPLTACNLGECVRDAWRLAKRYAKI